MKQLIQALFISLFLLGAGNLSAQTLSDSISVKGNCGMCQNKIEGAAKSAGAAWASWSPETGLLQVKYAKGKSDAARIQKAVAAAGYDTREVRATDAAYNALHGCCKYERTAAAAGDCCADGKCTKACCADGKCTADGKCCEGGKCAAGTASCCRKG